MGKTRKRTIAKLEKTRQFSLRKRELEREKFQAEGVEGGVDLLRENKKLKNEVSELTIWSQEREEELDRREENLDKKEEDVEMKEIEMLNRATGQIMTLSDNLSVVEFRNGILEREVERSKRELEKLRAEARSKDKEIEELQEELKQTKVWLVFRTEEEKRANNSYNWISQKYHFAVNFLADYARTDMMEGLVEKGEMREDVVEDVKRERERQRERLRRQG